jgi:uncharacterized membrane protein
MTLAEQSMNNKFTFLLGIFLILLAVIASAAAYSYLPEQVITHWNAVGEADGYSSRLLAVTLLPLFLAAMIGLLAALPLIDPLGANIAKFRPQYNWMIVLLGCFFLYVHLITLGLNLGLQWSINTLLTPVIGILFIAIGVLLRYAKRNWTFGIRTPWTLSNEIVWDRTHALGAILFQILGVLVVVAGLLSAQVLIPVLLFGTIIVAIWLVVYSYLEYRKLPQ